MTENEEAGDEVPLVHFFSANLGTCKLNGKTHYIGNHEQGKHPEQSIEEHLPEAPLQSVDGGSLETHIVHAEQGSGNQSDHNHDHHTLEVDTVAHMGALAGYRTRYTQEGIKSVIGGIPPGFFLFCHSLMPFL